MRSITFRLISASVCCHFASLAFAQNKMVLTLDNKEASVYGYTLGTPTGNAKEIDVFGALENVSVSLTGSLESGNPIPEIDIITTDSSAKTTQTLRLLEVTVKEVKNYTSNYTNGMFELTSSGSLNIEALCDFQRSELISHTDGNVGGKVREVSALNKSLERLETKPNSALKGSTGRVFLDLPADVECVIFIYNAGTDKEIMGTTKDRSFYLAPGKYDIKVSSVKMAEIEVQKGMDSRIKAGTLNINSPTAWALYDEAKKIRITGASKSEKIGLPVGNYQLQTGGSFRPVTIRDGETVDF